MSPPSAERRAAPRAPRGRCPGCPRLNLRGYGFYARLEYPPISLAALQAWDPVVGLVVGSYQGCSARGYTPSRAREVAERRARTEWRQMGARSEHEALGIFVHNVHRRWGSVFWRSCARHPRSPARHRGPNAEIAYARGQALWAGRSRDRGCTLGL